LRCSPGEAAGREICSVYGGPDESWLQAILIADLPGTNGELVIEDAREASIPASIASLLAAHDLRFFVAMPCCGMDGNRGALLCIADRGPRTVSSERRNFCGISANVRRRNCLPGRQIEDHGFSRQVMSHLARRTSESGNERLSFTHSSPGCARKRRSIGVPMS
jgi:hypothetical protein